MVWEQTSNSRLNWVNCQLEFVINVINAGRANENNNQKEEKRSRTSTENIAEDIALRDKIYRDRIGGSLSATGIQVLTLVLLQIVRSHAMQCTETDQARLDRQTGGQFQSSPVSREKRMPCGKWGSRAENSVVWSHPR